jgi:ADP-ribose pyrophosphatase YjhB (NUDIX family)
VNELGVWQYRVSRLLGRTITRVAAFLTLGRMPPFVSTAALILDGNRILVVVDPIRKEPVLPGGHLKWAERPHDALVREVAEETGYDIEPQDIVDVAAGQARAGERGVVRLIYRARITGGTLTSSSEGEATWLSLEEFAASDTRDAPIARAALLPDRPDGLPAGR